MGKIVRYTTVKEFDVNRHLEEGWQLYGSPIYIGGIGMGIMQAMIKCENENEEIKEDDEV